MQPSAFNLYVRGVPEPGLTLIHNTFSGAFVALEDELVDRLRRADAGAAPLTDEDCELLADPELVEPDVGIVVEDREAEERAFRAWFERRRDRGELTALVSVNLACNFACPYCSQASTLDGSVMSLATCDATADWLAQRARAAGVARVTLSFCGGEPLLHPGRIERVARRLAAALAPAGIELGFGLITNAWLLDDAVLDRLIPLGLDSAQVTLDGDASTHGLTRPARKGQDTDTYARVFGNAIAASRRIRVTIKGNYTAATLPGFAPLVAELASAGLPRGSRVTFSPALSVLGAPEAAGACTWSATGHESQVALYDAVSAYGFYPGAPIHAVGPCELHDRESFAIDPAGSIFKCPGFLGQAAWSIGDVGRAELRPLYARILDAAPAPGCTGCAHRPNCGGGCLANEWLRRGAIEGVSCERDYFDRVADAAVARELARATGAPVAAPPVPAGEALPESPKSTEPARGRRSASLRVLAA